ncbi:MAG: hypothetical protein LQ344_005079 [Seirophora lacunosa]|nr:MAG: hypothetical protein LQ344_005079 [Seirophora lacunosa]
MESCVEPSSPELKKDFKTFCERCSYITLDKNAGDDSFVELNERMETFIEADEAQNRHFYMALPPNIYTAVSEQLRRNCYSDKGDCQIIISMTEAIGTEGRGSYFDDVGIIRDVMQNRLSPQALLTEPDGLMVPDLMQLLALTTMERPGSFDAEDLRQEKVRSQIFRADVI